MDKKELISRIIEILGSDELHDNQISTYEKTSDLFPEDLVEDRTPFNRMISYADEMMYKIITVRDLVLSETYEEKDKK